MSTGQPVDGRGTPASSQNVWLQLRVRELEEQVARLEGRVQELERERDQWRVKATAPKHHKDCEWHFEQYPWECTCGQSRVEDLERQVERLQRTLQMHAGDITSAQLSEDREHDARVEAEQRAERLERQLAGLEDQFRGILTGCGFADTIAQRIIDIGKAGGAEAYQRMQDARTGAVEG